MGIRTHCFSAAAPPGRSRPTYPSVMATWPKYSVPSGPTAMLSALVMPARLGRSVPQPPSMTMSLPASVGAVSAAASDPPSAGGGTTPPMSGPNGVTPAMSGVMVLPPLPPVPRASFLRASIVSTAGPFGGGTCSRQPAIRNSTRPRPAPEW